MTDSPNSASPVLADTQARKTAVILLIAVTGMAIALTLGEIANGLFCWLAVPFFIFGGSAFRFIPRLRKRWKAVLCVLYYGVGAVTLAWLMLSVALSGLGP